MHRLGPPPALTDRVEQRVHVFPLQLSGVPQCFGETLDFGIVRHVAKWRESRVELVGIPIEHSSMSVMITVVHTLVSLKMQAATVAFGVRRIICCFS